MRKKKFESSPILIALIFCFVAMTPRYADAKQSSSRIIQVPNNSKMMQGSSTRSLPGPVSNGLQATSNKVVKSEAEWRAQLSEIEYYVLRQKGTEQPHTGQFANHKEKGVYTCRGCGQALFDSNAKYESGTGWPSFFQPLNNASVANVVDLSGGMVRTETVCSRCDGHLGHVFKDGPAPTGLRYCMNSAALGFRKAGEGTFVPNPTNAVLSKIPPLNSKTFGPTFQEPQFNSNSVGNSLRYPPRVGYPTLPATAFIAKEKVGMDMVKVIPVSSYAVGHHNGWKEALTKIVRHGGDFNNTAFFGPAVPSTSNRYWVNGLNDGFRSCKEAAQMAQQQGKDVRRMAELALATWDVPPSDR